MDNEPKKQMTPVYMSLPQLVRLIDLASNRKLDSVSLQIFRGYNFNESDASLAVGTLKFLGLVDENNKATPLMDKLRLKGDMRKQEFKVILETAYKRIFDKVDRPQDLPVDELTNEFNVCYIDSIKSDRVARAAVSAFLKLCEFAGLKEEGSITVASRKPRDTKPKATTERGHSKSNREIPNTGKFLDGNSNYHIQQILRDKVTVTIPEEWHLNATLDDDLNNEWRAVIKAAHWFTNSYTKKHPEQTRPVDNADNSG